MKDQDLSTNSNRPKWVIYRCAAYLTGKGIHFGSAWGKIFARRANDAEKFCIGIDPRKPLTTGCCNSNEVDLQSASFSGLADREYNWVFFDFITWEHPQVIRLVKDGLKKIKGSGHLMLLMPQGKWDWNTELAKLGSFVLKDVQSRDGADLVILKVVPGAKKGIRTLEAITKPKACIVRYGAIGDMLMITPVIRKLHEEGYHVTVNTSSYSASVLENNPFIDNTVVQERDVIYNPDLGQYWNEWKGSYDKYINLCESIEGDLLYCENRREFYSPAVLRHEKCNKNYWDYTMEKAGYPEVIGSMPEMYFSDKEEKNLKIFKKDSNGHFICMWAIKGSSYHKFYPYMSAVIRQFLSDKPDAKVALVGGPDALPMVFEAPGVVNIVNKWPIRSVCLLPKYSDLVVGPETGVINAAALFNVPKIVLLSHSSKENLTKYWTNTLTLSPDPTIAPCYGKSGCHQLHYTKESCPLVTLTDVQTKEAIGGSLPVCSVAIEPKLVLDEMNRVYEQWRANPNRN